MAKIKDGRGSGRSQGGAREKLPSRRQQVWPEKGKRVNHESLTAPTSL